MATETFLSMNSPRMPHSDSKLAHRLWLAHCKLHLTLWRAEYRTTQRLQKAFGYAVVSGGTDCDGMRFAGCEYFWTRAQAEDSLDHIGDYADGPVGGSVMSGRAGSRWDAAHVPDTRDRYAEAAGY